jgi:hypothetical protein
MKNERARAWTLAAALAAATLLAAPASQAQSCLATARTTEQATVGETEYFYDSAGHAVRGTGVVWRDILGNAIELDGGQAACWSGGFIDGPYHDDAVYECSSEHCPGGVCPSPCLEYHTPAGVAPAVTAPTVVENVHIKDYGDGVSQESSANRAPLEVQGVWLENIHDDAVENDFGASVKVIDTLIERAWIPFASRFRSGDDIDARGEVFEVRNTLVLMHIFPNTYKMRAGHGTLWKWPHNGMAPGFIVTDSVFVAEKLVGGLLFPLVDQLVECRNNKLLWAGTLADWDDALSDGDDSDGLDNRGRMAALSHCYTVIVKPASESKASFLAKHWDPLAAAWKATHAAAGGAPSPSPTPTTTTTTPTTTTTTTTRPATTSTTFALVTTTTTTVARTTTTSITTPVSSTTTTTLPAPAPVPNAPPQEPILLP